MSKSQYSILVLVITGAVSVFHVLVLTGLIPYRAVWAGKLQNEQEMYVFESISLLINIFLSWVVLQNNNWVQPVIPKKGLSFILRGFVLLFALNTIGNLFAENPLEQYLGGSLTALLAFLCLQIVHDNKEAKA